MTPSFNDEQVMRAIANDSFEWAQSGWQPPGFGEGFYKRLCEQACQSLNLKSRIEWDHYGSGSASFIDAWFYRDHADFAAATCDNYDHAFTGLWVLLHRDGTLYAMGEGTKTWDSKDNASSYLPGLTEVDEINTAAVSELASDMEKYLSAAGMTRLSKKLLQTPAPHGISLETNLDDGDFKCFDVLFNWMD